ncbi:MAG: histidine kinase [Clostridia bacterium]|nr:histidine kinase [Clostridia bacterium]
MSGWNSSFYIFIIGAVLLLSLMGLWFTAILPGMDRWSKRFFQSYFAVFLLCCFCAVTEFFFYNFSVQGAAYFSLIVLECLLLSLPLPMLTVYLAHCCGENMRSGWLLRAVAVVMAVYVALIASAAFIKGFYVVKTDGWLDRGPLYPVMLVPLVLILLLTFEETIRSRKRLSRKVVLGLVFSLVPMTAAMIAQMFIDVFQLIDICYVISGLTMYSFILSDQIEQDRRRQREIADQRASIMVLQMRPHFIYNTMTSIYCLCDQNPQLARQVIMDFTTYLRKNLNAIASAEPIPFTSELEHTRAYLAVERTLYEDSLSVDYDTPHTVFRIPALTLQPIVENAIKHGRDPYAGRFCITIRTRKTDSGSVLTVADNGRGFVPPDDSEPHIGLNNIRQRLEMMCGGRLDIGPNEGGGTLVTVTIPDSDEK